MWALWQFSWALIDFPLPPPIDVFAILPYPFLPYSVADWTSWTRESDSDREGDGVVRCSPVAAKYKDHNPNLVSSHILFLFLKAAMPQHNKAIKLLTVRSTIDMYKGLLTLLLTSI